MYLKGKEAEFQPQSLKCMGTGKEEAVHHEGSRWHLESQDLYFYLDFQLCESLSFGQVSVSSR